MLIEFIFPIVITVWIPDHFSVPFSETSALPDIVVLPFGLRIIGAALLSGTKFVMVWVCLSDPSV
jgi:hypothetical protein